MSWARMCWRWWGFYFRSIFLDKKLEINRDWSVGCPVWQRLICGMSCLTEAGPCNAADHLQLACILFRVVQHSARVGCRDLVDFPAFGCISSGHTFGRRGSEANYRAYFAPLRPVLRNSTCQKNVRLIRVHYQPITGLLRPRSSREETGWQQDQRAPTFTRPPKPEHQGRLWYLICFSCDVWDEQWQYGNLAVHRFTLVWSYFTCF